MKLILKGLGASAGSAKGIARILLPSENLTKLEEGEILITTLTDPTMANAMVKALAIVTDIGGITSHPAILSREMGIPCVVNTKEATKIIKTGMKILVDGEKGEIYELD
ncbi:MAG: hypothetical protein HY918_04875 [Candidatus Doudnabacteria bacterium]|nr:hypothetical protein [Candidatus Doudnabacteria bacterium]